MGAGMERAGTERDLRDISTESLRGGDGSARNVSV